MEERKQLMEDENMKEFLTLLDDNGLSDHKKDIEYLGQYIDQMESSFEQVLNELKLVRNELSSIQDKTLKATATRAVDRVNTKVEEAKDTLLKVKNHIKLTVDKAVQDFKTKGKEVLVTGLNKINAKGLLESIKNQLNKVLDSSDQEINKLTTLGDEVHKMNSHLKNVGRTLVGKDVQEIDTRNPNKGLLSKVQNSLFKVMEVSSNMIDKTDKVSDKLQSFEDKVNEKKSVKDELKKIKESKVNNTPSKTKEKAREL